jgi:phage repressor protein C with HTH and peptisase S24 domain
VEGRVQLLQGAKVNKYLFLINELEEKGFGYMTVFGQSMMPIIKSGSTLRFEKRERYEVGDIVFCKVRGRYIDAHKITKKNDRKGYMISNNHGWDNGWTKTVFGKVCL